MRVITQEQQERFDGYTNYRAYFFGNFYLSSIQQGIQASHVTSEFFVKYCETSIAKRMLMRWAINDPTVILLNGGYQDSLKEIFDYLAAICPLYDFPYAKFHEERATLNDCMTCVGFIIPEQVYGVEVPRDWNMTQEEWKYLEIKELISKYSLAN